MKRLAAIAAVALILVGCGTATDTSSDPSEPDAPETTDSDEDEGSIAAAQRGERTRIDCRRQVGPLLRELKGIDSRLNIGMTQPDYNTALGDASVAYDAIPIGRLSQRCVSTVAVHLEDAFNQYIKANDDWSDCIDDFYCDLEADALPELRQKWSNASRQIAKAERVLSNLSWY